MADVCVFCRIARGEIPAKIVAQSATCVAFWDLDQQAPIHLLVIPRAHVASLNDVTSPALLADLMQLSTEAARKEGIADSGYRVVFNTNVDGGQTVYHLHAHVLGGRRMTWPPG